MNRHERRKAEKLSEESKQGISRKTFSRDDVNKIIEHRDSLFQKHLSLLQNEMGDLIGHILELELAMNDICHTVAICRGDELREYITQNEVDYLEQLYVPIESFAKRNKAQNQVYVRVDMFKNAMMNFIEHKDNGESLRQIVDTIGTRASVLAEYRDTIKKPGPKSRTQWRQQIKDMCTEIENANPGTAPYQIRYKILERVGVRDPQLGYVGRPDVENASQIIKSLQTKEANDNPAAYFMRIKNMD